MDFELKRSRADKISKEELLRELARVAEIVGSEFGKRDFPLHAKFSAGPVVKAFGSWSKAIAALREHLLHQNIELKPKRRSDAYPDTVLFAEIERIWTKLGHRPSKNEWEAENPKIHYNTYKRRFGGWEKACLSFVEYKMGRSMIEVERTEAPQTAKARKSTNALGGRSISLGLRLQVLNRDHFRCVLCGRSPAVQGPGVTLHLDHIIPYAKGGPSTRENLQTLCHECNLGKGACELGA